MSWIYGTLIDISTIADCIKYVFFSTTNDENWCHWVKLPEQCVNTIPINWMKCFSIRLNSPMTIGFKWIRPVWTVHWESHFIHSFIHLIPISISIWCRNISCSTSFSSKMDMVSHTMEHIESAMNYLCNPKCILWTVNSNH